MIQNKKIFWPIGVTVLFLLVILAITMGGEPLVVQDAFAQCHSFRVISSISHPGDCRRSNGILSGYADRVGGDYYEGGRLADPIYLCLVER